MKNIAKHFQLKSVTKWVFINHPEWVDDNEYSIVKVLVKRITTLNGEVISDKLIESQDHVLRISTPESMAAEAFLRMNSISIDEEVYIGF